MNLGKKFYWVYKRFMLNHFRRVFIDQEWMRWKGYKVDWEHPRDKNEKIQWLLCYSDTSMWSLCADKYRVREYVKSKGQEDILVPLLGVWDKPKDIDFESLPEKFVIRCNHDSGSTIIVDKAKGFDPDAIRSDLASHLRRRFGYWSGEMFYNKIKRRIIAERYLEQDIPTIQGAPVDYKVWCFNGKPYSIWVNYNRTREWTYINVYDLDWNIRPEASLFNESFRDGKGLVPKPACLDEMLSVASVLSEGFPEVRVDFYISEGNLYFGEMTFSSVAGKMKRFTDEYLRELGAQCVLPEKKVNSRARRRKSRPE